MSAHVMETVQFSLVDGVSESAFMRAAEQSKVFVSACSGFIARRLSRSEDGVWLEQIEWASMQDAKAANAAISDAPDAVAFLKLIDGASVIVRHSELKIGVN